MRYILFWLEGFKNLFLRYREIIKISWENRNATDLKGYTREEAEFLPAVLAFQEKPIPILSRVVIWAIIGICAITLIWACIGKVDIIASATGKITTSTKNKIIQPSELSKIKKIAVRDGQWVKRGDLLVELDDTDAQASAISAAQNLATTRLLKMRSEALLKAFSENKSPEIPEMNDIDPNFLKQQRQLVTNIYNEYSARQQQLMAIRVRHQAEKRTMEMSAKRIHESLAFTEARTHDYKKLVDADYISRHEFLKFEQERVEQRGDLSVQRQRVQELNASVMEITSQQDALAAETRRIYTMQLNEAQEKLPSLVAEYSKFSSRLKDLTLHSPVNGVVQQLNIHTIGGVVTPAQTLMMIVPVGEPIEIEAAIENKDIGFVKENQLVEVKVEAFPFTKYGTLHGKIINISPDAIVDEKKGLTYTIKVRLDQNTMLVNGKKMSLTPGMAVNVEIKTGKRRLIEYFLSPFIEYQESVLKER